MTDSPLTAEDGGILEEAHVGPLVLREDPDDQKQVKKQTVPKTTRQPSVTSTESAPSRNRSQTTSGIPVSRFSKNKRVGITPPKVFGKKSQASKMTGVSAHPDTKLAASRSQPKTHCRIPIRRVKQDNILPTPTSGSAPPNGTSEGPKMVNEPTTSSISKTGPKRSATSTSPSDHVVRRKTGTITKTRGNDLTHSATPKVALSPAVRRKEYTQTKAAGPSSSSISASASSPVVRRKPSTITKTRVGITPPKVFGKKTQASKMTGVSAHPDTKLAASGSQPQTHCRISIRRVKQDNILPTPTSESAPPNGTSEGPKMVNEPTTSSISKTSPKRSAIRLRLYVPIRSCSSKEDRYHYQD